MGYPKQTFVIGLLAILTVGLLLMPSASIFNSIDRTKNVLPSSGATRAGEATLWDNKTIYVDPMKLDGVEIGDCDNDGSPEIVTCGLAGTVIMLQYDSAKKTWTNEEIWDNQAVGELITPAIGEFDSAHAGNEIVVCGMAAGEEADEGEGAVTELYYESGTWKNERILTENYMPHGVCIGDLDPDIPGNEVIVGSFSYNTTLVWKESGVWKNKVIFRDTASIKKTMVADFDPQHPGNELLIDGESMNATEIYKDGATWVSKVIFQAPNGLARLAIGELDPLHAGLEVVVGGDGGEVFLLRENAGNWTSLQLLADTAKNRGVWIGDVDPTHPGNELVTTGWSTFTYIISGSGSSWTSRLICTSADRLHDVRTGDFDPTHTGNEVVIIGYDKAVTIISISPWRATVLYTDPMKLDGVAEGDANNDGSMEVVTCGLGGTVTLMRYDSTKKAWTNEQIWDNLAQGELLTPAIGDFDSTHAGNEVVVCGMATGAEADVGEGAVTMLYYEGGTWKSEKIFTDDHMTHGVCVGDLDPDVPGSEVISGSFSYNTTISWKEGGVWKSEMIFRDTGKIKKTLVADIDPDHVGNELLVVGVSMNTTEVYKENGEWKHKVIYEAPSALARVTVGELDPLHAGVEVVVGGDGGEVILLEENDGNWTGLQLFKDTAKNRGVKIGDVDPSHAGNELVVTGWSSYVNVFWGSGSTWEHKLIHQATGRLHDIGIADFDPTHIGNEVVIIGYDKKVTAIANYDLVAPPSGTFTLSFTSSVSSIVLNPEETKEIEFKLTQTNFDGMVTISVSGLPSYLGYNLFPQSILSEGEGVLTLKHSTFKDGGTYTVKITATSGTKTAEISFSLTVNKDGVAPTITNFYPTATAGKLDPSKAYVMLTFSEPMNETTLSADNIKVTSKDGNTAYTCNRNYNAANNTLMLTGIKDTNGKDLPKGKEFKVTITAANVKDRGDNALTTPSDITFKTVDAEDEKDNLIVMIALVILAVLLVIIIVVLYLKNKKKDEEGGAEEEKDEEEKPAKKNAPKKDAKKGGVSPKKEAPTKGAPKKDAKKPADKPKGKGKK